MGEAQVIIEPYKDCGWLTVYEGDPDGEYTVTVTNAFGAPIGDIEFAEKLFEMGIEPTLYNAEPDAYCSIGFCERERRWYAWNWYGWGLHMVMSSFGIGDTVDSEDHPCSQSLWTDEFLAEHPEYDLSLPVGFKAKTLEDARKMAVAFADAVA